MKFGPVATPEALGAILAHSLKVADGQIRKGTVLAAAHLSALEAAGHAHVIAARLEAGDVPEDEAAARVAAALCGAGVEAGPAFTGRVNIFAQNAGIAVIDDVLIGEINRLDEALTVATVTPFARLAAGDMVATVKVIPFSAPERAVKAAEDAAGARTVIAAQVFIVHRAGLVLTRIAGMKESLLDKSREAVRGRLEACGSQLAAEQIVDHEPDEIAKAIRQLQADGFSPVLVFGASAIIDRGDVVPAGLEQADGTVRHLGMPVDPGNLMMLGELEGTPVLGVPSCARSPKLNGFDWVLERVLAGVAVEPADIQAMGAGGLLKEIPSRPQPRERAGVAVRGGAPMIAAIILAAGRSTRMGETNKLTEEVAGKALVRHVAESALASRADPVIVVTGHQRDAVETALAGLDVGFFHNPDFAQGLSTSLAAGLGALPGEVAGALICLGDMPGVAPAHLDRLIAAFDPDEGREICVPVVAGKRGNPVLWGRAFFHAMTEIEGDVGARHLIGENAEKLVEVEIGDSAVFEDIDTPEDAAAARARMGE